MKTNRFFIHKASATNTDQRVHKAGCPKMPLEKHRVFLGGFNSTRAAINEAKESYPDAKGCEICLNSFEIEKDSLS
ncbi:MAG: hypothetical protein ACJAT2_003617 [Bacteriovoracaceae bacterium]|jgi:hypothetical protein